MTEMRQLLPKTDWNLRLEERKRPLGRTPIMHHDWRRLLFIHWAWDEREIQRLLPQGLYVDTFEGAAFMGIVPFSMSRVRLWKLPPIGKASNFLELNLRTYVVDEQGRPGVWFFSLDAASPLAVEAARRLFHLPYEHAQMSQKVDINEITAFQSIRANTNLRLHYTYQPFGDPELAKPRSLEFFLVERYRLYAHDQKQNRLITGKIFHRPYQLQKARLLGYDDGLFELNGIKAPETTPDHVIYSPGADVEIFKPQLVKD